MTNHDRFMCRCIELASLGRGRVSPNPMVGAVIVHNDRIIGEGYHRQYGQAHAEVNAINSVTNKSLLKDSTIYVNLEPCAHHGKTPPCADLIADKGIPRVVIGCIDSFAKVAGKGVQRLQDADCELIVGVLEKESLEINKRFLTFHNKKRPYIILKWAETLDGFIDVERKNNETVEQYWITNNLAKKFVHKWRTEEDAFMVGTNTAINDNPKLTAREWEGKNPTRIVLDNNLRLSEHLHLFDNQAPTVVFNSKKDGKFVNTEFIKINFANNVLNNIMHELYKKSIQSVVIEGGRQLLNSFIENSLWDEARVFTGNKVFGNGTPAPNFKSSPLETKIIGDSKLQFFVNG